MKEEGLDRKVISSEVHRPGLELAGFFEHFGYERIIILGRTELAYLGEQTAETRKVRLRQLLFFNIPCIIITGGLLVLDELLELCNQKKIPLLRTPARTVSSFTSFLVICTTALLLARVCMVFLLASFLV